MIPRFTDVKSVSLFAAKIAVVLTVLIYLTQTWGSYYVDSLLPLYRTVLNLILHDYQVASLSVSYQHAEPVVAAHLITIKPQTINGHTIPVGITMDASTLAGHALKHVIIVVSAIAIWPYITLKERLIRLLLSIPFLLLLECIDIPLAIAGAVQDLVLFNLSPDYANNKPWLVQWLLLLDGGGRLMLSIAVPILISALRQITRTDDVYEPGRL